MMIKKLSCKKKQQRYARVFWRLVRVYFTILLGISRWSEFIRKNKKGADKKSILKIFVMIVLSVYIGGCFILVFGTMMLNVYHALKPLGMQRFMFELLVLTLFLLLFIPNFLLTLSTYSIGGIEQTLRAMPIPPHMLFGAKFCAHCFLPMLTSLFFFVIAAAIYGSHEHPSLSFYAIIFTGAIFFPLPIISLCYIIHIIIMRFTRVFKNKQFIMLIGSLFGLILAAAINTAVQLRQQEALTASLIQVRTDISTIITFLLPGRLFADALSAGTADTILTAFIPFVLFCTAIPVVLIAGFSKMYEQSLDGFDEKKIKKLGSSESRNFIRKAFNARPVFISLLSREIHTMNREPAYLLNGPFMIVFFPIMFAVMYLTGSLRIPPESADFLRKGFGALLAGICGAFLGSATSIAATAVSRDAHNLAFIKSLPVSFKRYMQAKLAHAMLFALLGTMIGTGGISLVFSLNFADFLIAVLIALSLALFCNLLALILDTLHPKLRWDSPAAAIKQNLNTLIMLFTDLFLVSLAALTVALTDMPRQIYTLVFSGIPLLVSGVIAYFFWPYAERKIQSFEM